MNTTLLSLSSLLLMGTAMAADDEEIRILVILADDLGVEQLSLYRPDATGLAQTPGIDEIAARGITFRNAWVNPFCSPTRATIQSGQYAWRTGIGTVIERLCPDYSMPLGQGLPSLLPEYRTAAFGKWHLEDQLEPDLLAPWRHGYDYFEGTMWGVPFGCGAVTTQPCNSLLPKEGSNYYSWVKTVVNMGELSTVPTSRYLPGLTSTRATEWIGANWDQPWFTLLAPQAPFEFQHCPPINLQTQLACSTCEAGSPCPPGPYNNAGSCFQATLESYDAKIQSTLRGLKLADPLLRPWWQTTTVIFLGDNGTGVTDSGFWPSGLGKGTLFNGGVHVPFIIAGRAVPNMNRGMTTEALANGVDVYATVLDLAGKAIPPGRDGVSLVPVLEDPSTGVRPFLYSEKFARNGKAPYINHSRAITDATYTYKLREADGFDYFYRLSSTAAEPNGPKKEFLLCAGAPCANLGQPELDTYLMLKAQLASIGL